MSTRPSPRDAMWPCFGQRFHFSRRGVIAADDTPKRRYAMARRVTTCAPGWSAAARRKKAGSLRGGSSEGCQRVSSVYEDAIPAAISHGRYAALAKVTVHSAVCSQTRLM
ncbi:hypothetical protein [Robiginitomaculum antarcticum]|uniref:hypothetical protein n=1 Tax=Robiginitomaculum antarcticum TaxID=437507 RepID=UPI00037A566B|nr:hypothetical protein [Robiginitomaculum antarcticum]